MAAFNLAALQQSHITRQQQPVLPARDLRQQGVVGRVMIPGVEAEHPQIRRQTPKVPIQNKPIIRQFHGRRVRKNLDQITLAAATMRRAPR